MKTFVYVVLAFAAVVAFVAPHGPPAGKGQAAHSAGGSSAGLAAAEARYAAAKEDKSMSSGGEMVLDRNGDGHFYATAQVDGRDCHMLVDTGASVVALTGNDARDMGLDWDPNALAPVARGASGPVMGVPVMLDDISVGDFEAHNVPAIIVPQGLPVSLLGQSFLSRVPKVEIADDTLTLSD